MPTSTVGVVGIDGAFVGSVFVSTALQAVLDILPETEVVPEGQLVQAPASVSAVAPALANLPAAHVVAVSAEQDADSEVCPVSVPNLPAAQGVQEPAPVADLYVPATHAVQLAPV